jgi:hypothetical protein
VSEGDSEGDNEGDSEGGGKDLAEIDNVGFETTKQTDREVGIAYFYELPGGIEEYRWVYRTPADIAAVPLEYELKSLPLP